MKCYCPKCGHGSEVSEADIRRQKGMVVCPKCLTTFKMPVTDSSAHDDYDDETPPPIPRRRTAQAAPPKPPVRRSSGTVAMRTAPKGRSSNAPASRPRRSSTAPRTTANRKPNTSGNGQSSITRGGCVVISIGVTAGFFLLYMLIGLIFDKI